MKMGIFILSSGYKIQKRSAQVVTSQLMSRDYISTLNFDLSRIYSDLRKTHCYQYSFETVNARNMKSSLKLLPDQV